MSPAALGAAAATWLPLLVVSSTAAGYVGLALEERRRRGWPAGRVVVFLLGAASVAAALSPGMDRWADGDFSAHTAQHLLLAMVGPLGLVLGAPVTLLLRTLPPPRARRLGRALHAPVVRVLTRPVVALALSSGGLVLLYLTPLYDLSTRSTAVHVLVHAHLVASGALFAWVVAGPDPAPRRAGVRARLVVLDVAIAVHASVAQLLYAGLLVQVHEPVAQMQAAGSLMYFGGDIAELLLAVALLVTWRRAPARPAYR